MFRSKCPRWPDKTRRTLLQPCHRPMLRCAQVGVYGAVVFAALFAASLGLWNFSIGAACDVCLGFFVCLYYVSRMLLQ